MIDRTKMVGEEQFLTLKNAPKKTAHKAKIVSVALEDDKFRGEAYKLVFEPSFHGANKVTLNGTSLNRLCDAFSDNEKKWKGKKITIVAGVVDNAKYGKKDAILVFPGRK